MSCGSAKAEGLCSVQFIAVNCPVTCGTCRGGSVAPSVSPTTATTTSPTAAKATRVGGATCAMSADDACWSVALPCDLCCKTDYGTAGYGAPCWYVRMCVRVHSHTRASTHVALMPPGLTWPSVCMHGRSAADGFTRERCCVATTLSRSPTTTTAPSDGNGPCVECRAMHCALQCEARMCQYMRGHARGR